MAMPASTSTSTNPKSNSNSSYDIFINHRGPDVKKTFASYLYHRLHSLELEVFLDKEEMQQGDYINSQIQRAIQTSSVHVAIFSVTYCESTWCLNELVSMLESKAPIIPVFYHVKPAELRWTEPTDGVYGKALQKLKAETKRDPQSQEETPLHDPATVKQWRDTLFAVAGISGFEVEADKSDEGERLEKVIGRVLMLVEKRLNVAKYPTGLDAKVKDFENKVLSSGRKPQVVGIVGLGGAGKTTLAKELFNSKSSQYNVSCFLFDVRENISKGSLTLLQSKLLKSLTRSDVQIGHKDEGIRKLTRNLSTSSILLVLDDVDDVDQVDALLPHQTSLHLDSLILITSRSRAVLTSCGVENSSIYKLDGLSEQHSLELFCCHAFSQPDPLPQFKPLTEQFIKACQGLPLTLKVLGALLRGKHDVPYWQRQLARLETILPSKIQNRLKISYESLDREEKQIFLDIACFLIGKDRDVAIRIWDASGWQGWSGFQNLQHKCLVELEVVVEKGSLYEMHMITMHDILRDLGRDIAGSLLPRRIWRCTENVIDDLFHQSSVITVRGIRMVLSEYHDEFDNIEMRRLQLVDTEGCLLERILTKLHPRRVDTEGCLLERILTKLYPRCVDTEGCLLERILTKLHPRLGIETSRVLRVKFPNLIWLCWKKCSYSCLPSWIPVKDLRVLQVPGSTLETLWQPESKVPLRLEELRVDGCKKLKSITGLEQATKLQQLHISGCSELEELPSMEALVSLEVLWAWGCLKLKSIPGFDLATKLRVINVGGCSELEALPSMATFVSLEQLRVEGCVKLKTIEGLEEATKLRWLDVRWCFDLEALQGMEGLESLEELRAAGCMKLTSIWGLEQATKLRLLDIRGCIELEALPSMQTLLSLEKLWAVGCVKLKSIRGISQCIQLRELNVSQWSVLEEAEGRMLDRFDYEDYSLQWRRRRS